MPAKKTRAVFQLRLPVDLVRKLDDRAAARRRQLGTAWSRNDEITALLTEAVNK